MAAAQAGAGLLDLGLAAGQDLAQHPEVQRARKADEVHRR
jgi:hypothetical protein